MGTDARVRYTKRVIREVFTDLLQHTPIDKITVTAICEKAQINRATFYKYYDNPSDLMDQLEQEALDEIRDKIEAAKDAEFDTVLRIVLTDFQENQSYYRTLFSDNGDVAFKNRMLELCYQDNMKLIAQRLPGLEPRKQEWLYYFLAEGCNGILHRWISDGMKEPVESVVKFATKLVMTMTRNLSAQKSWIR